MLGILSARESVKIPQLLLYKEKVDSKSNAFKKH